MSTELCSRSYITEGQEIYFWIALHEHYWLPIKVRIEFKIITRMYQVLRNSGSPAYLKNLICHNTHVAVAGNLDEMQIMMNY